MSGEYVLSEWSFSCYQHFQGDWGHKVLRMGWWPISRHPVAQSCQRSFASPSLPEGGALSFLANSPEKGTQGRIGCLPDPEQPMRLCASSAGRPPEPPPRWQAAAVSVTIIFSLRSGPPEFLSMKSSLRWLERARTRPWVGAGKASCCLAGWGCKAPGSQIHQEQRETERPNW